MPKLMLTKETLARLENGPLLQVHGGDTLVPGPSQGMIGWCFGRSGQCPPPPPPSQACVPNSMACMPDSLACGGYTDWCVGV